jgi:hypothetical protein
VVPDVAKLIVKQVREIVEPKEKTAAPFLLNDPAEYVVFQGEFGDAFAYHRMKSVLDLQTRNLRLVRGQLAKALHQRSAIEFLSANSLAHLMNGPRGWPGDGFSLNEAAAVDRWYFGTGAARTDYKLRTTLNVSGNVADELVFTQRDLQHTLTAIYQSLVPYVGSDGNGKRRSDSVTIVPRDSLVPRDEPIVRDMMHPSGVTVQTKYFWPKYGGFVIIKTLPLAAWKETRITGLTTDPIVLASEFAQTYAPGHHNFYENFIFEPGLDSNLTATQRAELEAKNIRLLHIRHDNDFGQGDAWQFLGLDGKFRSEP